MSQGPIYRPQGRAAEYSHLALNTYSACANGCTYCYLRTRYKNPEAPIVRPYRGKILQMLPQQLKLLTRTKERVLLCFSCDPYQGLEKQELLTFQAIRMLHDAGIPFQVLTKCSLAERDFNFYGPDDAFATTLTLLDERWKAFEPNASSPTERLRLLIAAHEMGIETWVSLEPVLDSDESLRIIKETCDFVDLYKIGKLNHVAPPRPIDWRAFAIEAVELCEKLGKPYYLKDSLANLIPPANLQNTDNRRSDWKLQYRQAIGAAPGFLGAEKPEDVIRRARC